MIRHSAIRLLATLLATMSPTIAHAQSSAIVSRSDPSIIRAIASATNGDVSGVFIADNEGRIYFHSADEGVIEPELVATHGTKFGQLMPLRMSFSEPYLYIYDGITKKIWTLDYFGEGAIRSLKLEYDFTVKPAQLAVSPDGLVAFIDKGKLIFFQEGSDPVVYGRGIFSKPISLAFITSDTISVLDAGRAALVTIEFARYGDGRIRFTSETNASAVPVEGEAWTGMDVYRGLVYLSSRNNVYAVVESRLFPALPQTLRVEGIRDIALDHESFYLRTRPAMVRTPRTVPIDILFEADVVSSQGALLELYSYLAGKDLLPTQNVVADKDYLRLDDFLFANDVLITPNVEEAADVRVVEDQQQYAYRGKDKPEQRKDDDYEGVLASQAALKSSICNYELNRCLQPSTHEIGQRQVVSIPDVKLQRELSRERIVLDKPLSHYLRALIPSDELRNLVNVNFIKRLNPELTERSESEVLALDRGTVVLPVEKWALTTSVPATDFDNRESELWLIPDRFAGVSIRSRSALIRSMSKSMLVQDPDEEGGAAANVACAKLRTEHDRLLSRIHYPTKNATGAVIGSKLVNEPVRIGILEKKVTILTSHQAFNVDSTKPVWHEFNGLGELVPVSREQSAEENANGPATVDSMPFSLNAHHGTHVAALIAARSGKCWSGLLPSSRLVLIDLNDSSRVQQAIKKALFERVQVFNVSQALDGDRDELHDSMLLEGRALWVAAAGNDGLDLDNQDAAVVPAPARWGEAANIVAVAASDENGNVIEDMNTADGTIKGSNRGKKYIDLVAPGKDIYSALEGTAYGPATGTSQAAPLVSAAAAILVDQLGARLTPGDVKARLIATADWKKSYEGKVWGGRLDFGAAVMFPDLNLLRTVTDSQQGDMHSITVSGDPKIEILQSSRLYERSGAAVNAPINVKFSDILSLRRQESGLYRLVFRQAGTDFLKIVLDAKLDAAQKLECTAYDKLEKANGTFRQDNAACAGGLSVTTIDTFIQGGAYQIVWGVQP